MSIALGILGIVAMGVAAWLPDGSTVVDWLLLGAIFTLDELNRPVLLATGIAWTSAALIFPATLATQHKLSMGGVIFGNALAVAAGDPATLFCGFAVMSLSAYGLFLPDSDARRAGHIYILYAIFAEIALFTGMIAIEARAGATDPALPLWVTGAVLAGFGVKAGLVPFHGTLPLSYRHVPLTAAVVLAGAAINTGVLGWLRWLGDTSLMQAQVVSEMLTVVGVGSYLYAVVLGLCQRHPKAILGYSSISQIALLLIVLSAGLTQGENQAMWFAGLAAMALWHAAAKTALFTASLGYPDTRASRLVWWSTVALAGAALTGMAFTTGYAAKTTITQALAVHDNPAGDWLWVSGVLSAALVTRYVVQVRHGESVRYSATQIGGLAFSGAAVAWLALSVTGTAPAFLAATTSAVPILAGITLAWGWSQYAPADTRSRGPFAIGDITTVAALAAMRAAARTYRWLDKLPDKFTIARSGTEHD